MTKRGGDSQAESLHSNVPISKQASTLETLRKWAVRLFTAGPLWSEMSSTNSIKKVKPMRVFRNDSPAFGVSESSPNVKTAQTGFYRKSDGAENSQINDGRRYRDFGFAFRASIKIIPFKLYDNFAGLATLWRIIRLHAWRRVREWNSWIWFINTKMQLVNFSCYL